jgi:peptidylprolyl isomerase
VTTTAKRQRQREGRVARMEAERKAAIKAARRRRVIMAVVVAAIVVGLMALVAVVGGGDDDGDQASDPGTTTTEATPSTTAPEKPEVTIPEGPAPTTLQSTDLTVGDGEEAQTGDTLTVHYVGKIYATGDEFDSSYDGEAIQVQLLAPGIIEGWAQGLVGVQAGGRRQLVVPPDLGYGPEGDPPTIPPNSTLVFVIDVLDVEKAPAQPGG